MFAVTLDRKLMLQWLFPLRGPRRQASLAGVEVKATLHAFHKDHISHESALVRGPLGSFWTNDPPRSLNA